MNTLLSIDRKIDDLLSVTPMEKIQAGALTTVPCLVQIESALQSISSELGKIKLDPESQALGVTLPEPPCLVAEPQPASASCCDLEAKIQKIVERRQKLAQENADLAAQLEAANRDGAKAQHDLKIQKDLLKEAKDEARKLMFDSAKKAGAE